MGLDLEYGYVKMCRNKKKSHVAHMDKLGKTIKTSLDHNSHPGVQIKENE
jgi:hypothetical protein